jgi:hypothetical protein
MKKFILFALLGLSTLTGFGQDTVKYKISDMERSEDKFTKEITIENPGPSGFRPKIISLIKYIKGSKISYALYIAVDNQSTCSINEKGVTILFKDGTKWSKPSAKVGVESGSDGFDYSSFITLSTQDLKVFKSKKIEAVRLYIYDEDISEDISEGFITYTNYIEKVK